MMSSKSSLEKNTMERPFVFPKWMPLPKAEWNKAQLAWEERMLAHLARGTGIQKIPSMASRKEERGERVAALIKEIMSVGHPNGFIRNLCPS